MLNYYGRDWSTQDAERALSALNWKQRRAVVQLSLVENKLTCLPGALQELTGLEALWLEGNLLHKIDGLTPLTGLRVLDLSKNLLQELPPDFGELSHLQEIYLKDNLLTSLP